MAVLVILRNYGGHLGKTPFWPTSGAQILIDFFSVN